MIFWHKHFALILLFFSGFFFWLYFWNVPFLEKDSLISNTSFSGIISTNKNESDDIFSSQKIDEAENLITKEYYHFSEKSKTDIENGVISGLVSALGDKHSVYFPPTEAEEFSDTLRGDFEGIGAVIDENPKWVKIQKILENSPAEKVWLKNGDIITKVDGKSIVGMSADDAVKKIRGPRGSTVNLSYLRDESNNEQVISVKRDRVLIPSTRTKILTGSIGYVEVGFFGEHTNEEFRKSITSLTASGVHGIILDFRNNPGWYLDSAIDLLSMILPDGTASVITRENDPKKTQTLYTKWNSETQVWLPLVMIINGLSASASEITAWALQDYKRAIIVGEKSYGKWSVQSPFVMSDGSILKLTIGKWFTPKDRWIDGEGITPDIIIPLKDDDYKNLYDRQLEWARKIMDSLISQSGSVEKTIEITKKITF